MNEGAQLRRVGFSLGSNLGDRLATLESACDHLADVFGALRLSQVYETAPVGCPPGSPAYINACVEVETDMPAPDILQLCMEIEKALGRTRNGVYGEARTCDIDLLYCGAETYDTAELTLPHPRAHERAFVLRPLCDINPALKLPRQDKTVAELLAALPPSEGGVKPFPI